MTPAFLEKAKKQIQRMHKEESDKGREVCLLLSPSLMEAYHYYPENYPLELLAAIYKTLPFSDTIYLKEGKNCIPHAFVELIADNCNQMTVWIAEEERYLEWEALAEQIYANTGLLLKLVEELPEVMTLEKDKWRKTYPALFFDFSDSSQMEQRKLGRDSFYVDFYPTKRKRRILNAKRSDVTYQTYANFLDKNAENTV